MQYYIPIVFYMATFCISRCGYGNYVILISGHVDMLRMFVLTCNMALKKECDSRGEAWSVQCSVILLVTELGLTLSSCSSQSFSERDREVMGSLHSSVTKMRITMCLSLVGCRHWKDDFQVDPNAKPISRGELISSLSSVCGLDLYQTYLYPSRSARLGGGSEGAVKRLLSHLLTMFNK